MTQRGDQIPKKIDRYEVVEAVGFGAMGAVYRAFDPLIKRPVALKTLRVDVPPQSPDYKEFLLRFETEARTAGRLSHPNIITLYDVGHTDGQVPWLAMEFVEGQTVAELLEGERLAPELVVSLISQIATALDYAHGEGVIHRDIKPSNVMVFNREKVKVADFGIAKLMDAEMTNSGLMMGTPSYMSPEQAMGEELDGRSDVFSLGVVAFEMLCGQQPFPGNNVTSILYKLVHTDPVRPDDLEVFGLLPHKWHEVFAKALAKDPTERFQTAADFVVNLEQCLEGFGAVEDETVVITDNSMQATPSPIAVSDEEDETVVDYVAPPEASAPSRDVSGRELVDRTVTLERDASSLEETAEDDAQSDADDDETIVVGPSDDTDKALYSETVLDETFRASDGVDETIIPAQPSANVIDRLRALPPKSRWVVAALLGATFLTTLAALVLLFSSGDARLPEVAPPPAPVALDPGALTVTSEPEGARVFINGEERGITPLELEALPLGEYALRVAREGFLTQELDAALTVAAPFASLDVALEPEPKPEPAPAYVLIRSVPEGARVTIDGREVGATPTERRRVAAGGRVVRLEREGFLPWEDTVRARHGNTVEVDAVLTVDRRSAAPPSPTSDPPPAPIPRTPPTVTPGMLVARGDPGVVEPRCIECPGAPYPEQARRLGLEGVVELSFIIDENGHVTDLTVQNSGGEMFDEAAARAVGEWRYQPATKNGVPVKMRWVQRFRFRRGR